MELMIIFIVAFLGVCFGSFAGAQVWRLRARQIDEDKRAGGEYDKSEWHRLKPLIGSVKKDRSRCLHCKAVLKWYDLLPLVSWIGTSGRCRYCKNRIGLFEPLIELGTGALFVLIYLNRFTLTGVYDISALLVLWLIAAVLLVILLAYDLKWLLLPDVIVFPLIGIAIIIASLQFMSSSDADWVTRLVSLGGSLLILSGIYYVLWIVSKGAWIGFGDVKLGIALGLLTGEWVLAFLALFLANLIGCLIVLPGMAAKKYSRSTQVPFGPMLIVGTLISVLWGDSIIAGYTALSLSLISL